MSGTNGRDSLVGGGDHCGIGYGYHCGLLEADLYQV